MVPLYRSYEAIKDDKGDGLNALMMASCNGNEDIVRLLAPIYEEDGKLNEKNILGQTALDYAKMYGHSKIAEILTNTIHE